MKHRFLLSINFVLIIGLLIGCGEKEDKDILEARQAIANRNYPAAKTAVQTALSHKPGLPEAQSLQLLLQLHATSGEGWKTEAADWQGAIQKVLGYLQPLKEEIKTLEVLEDPDSDDLDRLERLVRARNSIAGLLANSLAEATVQNPKLLSDLVNQADTGVITALLEAEKCFEPAPRKAAERLIQQRGTEGPVTDLLIKETRNPDAAIRKQAVKHLGDLKEPKLLPIFESVLKNKNEAAGVLYNVIVALERLKDEPPPPGGGPMGESLSPPRGRGGTIVPALKLATQTNVAQVRMHAAKLLGLLKAEDAITDLIRLSSDSNTYVKNSAITALIRLGEPAINPLIAVLDSKAQNIIPDKNPDFMDQYQYIANVYIDAARLENRRVSTQAAVIQVLGALKAKAAISRLIDLLENDDLRGSASAALTAMAGVAVPDVIQSLRAGRDEIRIQSAAVLRDIGDPRAVEPLIEALKNEPRKEVKAIAAQALGNMKAHGVNNGAIEPLTQALTLDDTTATNAATALGQIKISSEPAIQKLIAIALDKRGRETVRSAALFALSQLAPVQAVQPMMLLMLSDETSAIIRKGAVTVLGEIQAKETVPALLWALATRYEDIKDFQRHMKREYRTIAGLSVAMDGLKIQWTPEYPKPDYQTWSEMKPIPGLVRGEAAISLGKIKGDEVVEPLIQALENDERAAVRRSAAWALGEIKGDAVIPPLERALKKDEQGIVRWEVAIAFGKIKGDKVVEPLLTALKKDKYETTRKQAAIALRELNPILADDGLVDVLKKGVGAFEEGKEAQSVLDEVMGALIKDGNATTAKFLLDALKSADDKLVRWSIVYTLGAIKDPSAVNAMTAELTNSSYIVRKEAVATLGGYKDRKVIDALIKVLQDGNESKAIRAEAAVSLGTLLDERASAPLRAALDDENAEVRLQAVAALGDIKDAAAVDKLIGLLQNPLEDASVRAACVTALGAIGDKKANAVLLNILRTEPPFEDIDQNAITALGNLKSVEAVPELIRILEERGAEANARTRAATALAAIGDPRAAEPIARRLVDESEYAVALDGDGLKRNWTWEQFVAAARSFQLPVFIAPKMIERIENPWEERPIKAAATIALGLCNSPQAPSELRKQISSPIVLIRQAAALSIGEGKVRELKDDLVKIMKGETEKNHDVRRSATQGLGELADASTVPALIEVLKDDSVHEEIRRDAAIALGKIGGDAAVSALVEKLGTLQASKTAKDLRLDIIAALTEARNQKAVPVLKTVLDDENADLHFRAADALFQLTGDGYGYQRAG